MRKFNAVLSMSILVLFIIHGVAGGFQLSGIIPGGSKLLKVLSWVMAGMIAVHAVIGIKLTIDSIAAVKKSGASYFRENKLFWVRRISGFAVMIFILLHIMIFMGKSGEAYRLHIFEGMELMTQILLVITVAVHVLTNIRPLMTAMGSKKIREIMADIMIVMSVILFFTGAAFVIYYLRWNVF